jgi:hypothetical protein
VCHPNSREVESPEFRETINTAGCDTQLFTPELQEIDSSKLHIVLSIGVLFVTQTNTTNHITTDFNQHINSEQKTG